MRAPDLQTGIAPESDDTFELAHLAADFVGDVDIFARKRPVSRFNDGHLHSVAAENVGEL